MVIKKNIRNFVPLRYNEPTGRVPGINKNIMDTKTTIYDFDFEIAGYGHYKVTYTSPVTGKKWTAKTNDMQLIDATKNADEPKRKGLEELKRVCKGGEICR